METELCKLAEKYGTDKCPKIRHSYTPEYYKLLSDKKDSIKKVLEMGIGSVVSMRHVTGYLPGASHRMWRDFFPNAEIYGIDYVQECMFKDNRIQTFLVDMRDHNQMRDFIKKVGNDFDLVIDDGPHRTRTQIQTARLLLPLLDDKVIYIIEDSHNPEELAKNLPEYKCEVIRMASKEVRDDNLVIVRK